MTVESKRDREISRIYLIIGQCAFKSITNPRVDVVRRSRGGVEHYVRVSNEEVSLEFSRDGLQIHFFHTPHLQARFLPCSLKHFVVLHSAPGLRGHTSSLTSDSSG